MPQTNNTAPTIAAKNLSLSVSSLMAYTVTHGPSPVNCCVYATLVDLAGHLFPYLVVNHYQGQGVTRRHDKVG